MKTRLHRSSSTQGLMKPFIFSVNGETILNTRVEKIYKMQRSNWNILSHANKNKISMQAGVVVEIRFTTQGE